MPPFKSESEENKVEKMIEVHGLSKSFGRVQAVQDISFYVETGALFAFLGTNGAGKSTTISILLTLLKQDAGDVKVNGYTVGKDDAAIRREIGIVFQESVLDDLLTVKENLDLRCALYGFSRAERQRAIKRAAAITDCTSFLNRPYGKCSGGQRRRADIARALLHEPKLFILDEPTTGLDPQSRKHIWEMILQLQQETNMTIFLTTHYIEEAANSDYVIVMKEGRIVGRGTPDQLKERYSAHRLHIVPTDRDALLQKLQADGVACTEEKHSLSIPLAATTDAIPLLSRFERWIESFEVRKSSLDDVFITISGNEVPAE